MLAAPPETMHSGFLLPPAIDSPSLFPFMAKTFENNPLPPSCFSYFTCKRMPSARVFKVIRYTSPVLPSFRSILRPPLLRVSPSKACSVLSVPTSFNWYFFFSREYFSSPVEKYLPFPSSPNVTVIHESPSLNFQPQLTFSFQASVLEPVFCVPSKFHRPMKSCT